MKATTKVIKYLLVVLLLVGCIPSNEQPTSPTAVPSPTPVPTETPKPTAELAFSTIGTETGRVDSSLVSEDIIIEVSPIYMTVLVGDINNWTNPQGAVIGEGSVPNIGSMVVAGASIRDLDLPVVTSITSPCTGGYDPTQGFNPSGGHSGYDIVCNGGQGAPIIAQSECVVWRTFDNLGYDGNAEGGLTWEFDVSGRTVVCASKIAVSNLPPEAQTASSTGEVIILTISGHMMFEDAGHPYPVPGDRITAGTQIGRQGNTGYTSGGVVTRYTNNQHGSGTHVHNSVVILTENGYMYHVNPANMYTY
ncbi:MAG: hypothetical protein ACOZAO_01380 [Patescibacteria group bacterium]